MVAKVPLNLSLPLQVLDQRRWTNITRFWVQVGIGNGISQTRDGLDTVDAGHSDIAEHQVEIVHPSFLQSLLAVGRLGHRMTLRLEQHHQALTQSLIVVH